jgi:alkaline phosphatase
MKTGLIQANKSNNFNSLFLHLGIIFLGSFLVITNLFSQPHTVPFTKDLLSNQITKNHLIPASLAPSNSPVNILLFIGDGMGSQQRTAATWVAAGINGTLAMDQLSYQGWSQTASANQEITDSAAGATAMATGHKTNNGYIAMDPEGYPITTILEYAQEKGMSVGLVTTVQISHATPASFAAHVTDRNQMTYIAFQLIEHRVNVLLGGGEDQFLPVGETGCYPQDGERSDGRNLVHEAQVAGYLYVCNAVDFNSIDPLNQDFVLGLFADDEMQRPFQPDLSQMTEKAIQILSKDPDGFFLMVEGGQIDWAAHNNDAASVIQDTIDFDKAVQIGKSFTETSSDSIMIVTADHETGGMDIHLSASGLTGEDGPFYSLEGIPFFVSWSTTSHTSVDVPITAQGIGANSVSGHISNTDIFWLMARPIFNSVYLPTIQK